MVFTRILTCAAAECNASSDKQADSYPFMKDIVWVKWPRSPIVSQRWKILIRRTGKDPSGKYTKLNVNRVHTKLCSRHFDRHCIDVVRKESSRDPKYFAWNNWGKAMIPDKPDEKDGTHESLSASGTSESSMENNVDNSLPDSLMTVEMNDDSEDTEEEVDTNCEVPESTSTEVPISSIQFLNANAKNSDIRGDRESQVQLLNGLPRAAVENYCDTRHRKMSFGRAFYEKKMIKCIFWKVNGDHVYYSGKCLGAKNHHICVLAEIVADRSGNVLETSCGCYLSVGQKHKLDVSMFCCQHLVAVMLLLIDINESKVAIEFGSGHLGSRNPPTSKAKKEIQALPSCDPRPDRLVDQPSYSDFVKGKLVDFCAQARTSCVPLLQTVRSLAKTLSPPIENPLEDNCNV